MLETSQEGLIFNGKHPFNEFYYENLWSYLNAMSIIEEDLFYWMPCSKKSTHNSRSTDIIINCGPWSMEKINTFYHDLYSTKRPKIEFLCIWKTKKQSSTFWNVISWFTACLFFPLFCWSYYFYATNSWHFVHILNYIKGQHQTQNSNEIEMKSTTNRLRHRNLSSTDNSRSMSCDLR